MTATAIPPPFDDGVYGATMTCGLGAVPAGVVAGVVLVGPEGCAVFELVLEGDTAGDDGSVTTVVVSVAGEVPPDDDGVGCGVTGASGAAGVAGSIGAAGSTGVAGVTGAVGSAGADGSTGNTGVIGVTVGAKVLSVGMTGVMELLGFGVGKITGSVGTARIVKGASTKVMM
jgi:hypothetical protein